MRTTLIVSAIVAVAAIGAGAWWAVNEANLRKQMRHAKYVAGVEYMDICHYQQEGYRVDGKNLERDMALKFAKIDAAYKDDPTFPYCAERETILSVATGTP